MFENMTLKEKIFQTFIADRHAVGLAGGFEKFFEKYPVGGMFLAGSYVKDMGALMECGDIDSKEYVRLCRQFSKVPLLVCADGANIPGGGLEMSLSGAGASDDESVYFEYGKMRGIEMNYSDIDWIFAPCMDIDYAKSEHTSQMITDNEEFCVKFFTQAVKGIQSRGTAATVKHFPGQGTYHVNFHFAPGRNIFDFDKWMKTYGYAYKEMFKAGCMSVMTSHMIFPKYCYESEDGFPPVATFSKKITTELLKNTLGFEGVVVTDALTMGGMSCGNTARESAQAFKCGADMLLWPPMETADIIESMINSGEIPMSRLEDALSRIEKLRKFVAENKKQAPENAKEIVDDFARKTYKLGPELLKNQNNALPLKKSDKILLIANAVDGTKKMNDIKEFYDILSSYGYDVTYREHLLTCYQDEVDEIINGYDKVMFVLNHKFILDIDNCSSTTWASHLVDKSRKIVLNFSHPLVAEDFYPDEPCIVNTNTELDKNTAVAVIEKLIGNDEFTGKAHYNMEYMR